MNFKIGCILHDVFIFFFLFSLDSAAYVSSIKNINMLSIHIFAVFFASDKSQRVAKEPEWGCQKKIVLNWISHELINQGPFHDDEHMKVHTPAPTKLRLSMNTTEPVLQLVIAFLSTSTKLRLIYQMNLSYISINDEVIHLIQLVDGEKKAIQVKRWSRNSRWWKMGRREKKINGETICWWN